MERGDVRVYRYRLFALKQQGDLFAGIETLGMGKARDQRLLDIDRAAAGIPRQNHLARQAFQQMYWSRGAVGIPRQVGATGGAVLKGRAKAFAATVGAYTPRVPEDLVLMA